MKNALHTLLLALAATCPCGATELAGTWGPVSNNVKMSIMVTPASSGFTAGAFYNLPRIIQRLTQQSDPVCSFIWSEMSGPEQLLLKNFQPTAEKTGEAREVVLQALNNVVKLYTFYNYDRCSGIFLPGDTMTLFWNLYHGGLGTVDMAHFNHLLLEDAFRGDLWEDLAPGDTNIKMGDPVTLSIAITNLSATETQPVFNGGASDEVSFVIVEPSGKRLIQKRQRGGRMGRSFPLEPHQMSVSTHTLSTHFKFDQIGNYTITATTRMTRSHIDTARYEWVTVVTTVVSNPLTVTIVPGNLSPELRNIPGL